MDNQVENTSKSRSKNRQSVFRVVGIVVCLLFFGLSVYFGIDTLTIGTKAAAKAYEEEKDKVSQETYEKYYQTIYELSEKKHHVSNDVQVSIDSIKEQADLEVLQVHRIEYITPEEDTGNLIQKLLKTKVMGNIIAWLEVPGTGVFTVNLRASEFIIDNTRKYVLVRVPAPELTHSTIDYANIRLLYFQKSGLFNNTAKVGEDKARNQLQSAESRIYLGMSENQEYSILAKRSAKTILPQMIKAINPNIPDLKVEVEFIQ